MRKGRCETFDDRLTPRPFLVWGHVNAATTDGRKTSELGHGRHWTKRNSYIDSKGNSGRGEVSQEFYNFSYFEKNESNKKN